MQPQENSKEFLPTRSSLLKRLKNPDDNRSWKEFLDTYRNLIFHIAKKEGCTDDEAEEVVQLVLIHVAGRIERFQYDPKRSFKAWLMQATRWRAIEQLRRRSPVAARHSGESSKTSRTRTIERVAAPTKYGQEAKSRVEHQSSLLYAALERIKNKVSARHYQVFSAYVAQEKPIEEVCRTLGVTVANAHQIASRIRRSLQKEIELMEMDHF